MTDRPDDRGYFGQYGGKFVPETLMPALDELEAAYADAMADADFQKRVRPAVPRLYRPADAALSRPAAIGQEQAGQPSC